MTLYLKNSIFQQRNAHWAANLILYRFVGHIKAVKTVRFAVSTISAYQNSQLMIPLPQIKRFSLNNNTIANIGIEQIKTDQGVLCFDYYPFHGVAKGIVNK